MFMVYYTGVDQTSTSILFSKPKVCVTTSIMIYDDSMCDHM